MAVSPKTLLSGSVVIWLRWFAALASLALAAQAAEWPKTDKAELAETKPKIDPTAGAEILARETTMDHFTFSQQDRSQGTIYYGPSGAEDRYYVRVKIFSDQGVQRFSPLKLSYDSTATIQGFAARTIKPDGTIVEVTAADIHDDTTVLKSGRKMKLRSVSFPALTPGAIVEYRYSTHTSKPTSTAILSFQSSLPIRSVKFKIGTFKHPVPVYARKYELNSITYNCPLSNLVEKNGFVTFEKKNLPATKAEPFQPPSFTTSTTLIMFLKLVEDQSPDAYWSKFGKSLQAKLEPWIKDDPKIAVVLPEIINASDSADTKLNKLHDWCRTAIQNRERETTKLSKDETAKLAKPTKASDVLAAKVGSAGEINSLFAALAKAAGFDVRAVACNDRTAIPFNKNLTEAAFMLPDRTIGIQVGSQWRYFNPGASYLPAGALAAKNADTAVLIGDAKGLEQPMLAVGEPADANNLARKATFTLTADGKLTGDVTETYSGLMETELKERLDALSEQKRAGVLAKHFAKTLPQAVLTNVKVENADNPIGQLKITYHLEIPNYAQKVGSRLSFQPAVFQKNKPAAFIAPTRNAAIIFPYRIAEKDELTFIVPEELTLATEATPKGLDATGLGLYNATLAANAVTREITYNRESTLTDISFKSKVYAQVKSVFDHIHTQDQFVVTLKRTDSTPEQDAADNAAENAASKDPGAKQTEPANDDDPSA